MDADDSKNISRSEFEAFFTSDSAVAPTPPPGEGSGRPGRRAERGDSSKALTDPAEKEAAEKKRLQAKEEAKRKKEEAQAARKAQAAAQAKERAEAAQAAKLAEEAAERGADLWHAAVRAAEDARDAAKVARLRRAILFVFGCGWVCVPTSITTSSVRITTTTIHTLTQRRSARFRRDSGVRIWWSERLGSVWSGNGRWILPDLSDLSEISGRRGRLERESGVSMRRSGRFGAVWRGLDGFWEAESPGSKIATNWMCKTHFDTI